MLVGPVPAGITAGGNDHARRPRAPDHGDYAKGALTTVYRPDGKPVLPALAFGVAQTFHVVTVRAGMGAINQLRGDLHHRQLRYYVLVMVEIEASARVIRCRLMMMQLMLRVGLALPLAYWEVQRYCWRLCWAGGHYSPAARCAGGSAQLPCLICAVRRYLADQTSSSSAHGFEVRPATARASL